MSQSRAPTLPQIESKADLHVRQMNGNFVPRSRLCMLDLAPPSTNVRFGEVARQYPSIVERPEWAACAMQPPYVGRALSRCGHGSLECLAR